MTAQHIFPLGHALLGSRLVRRALAGAVLAVLPLAGCSMNDPRLDSYNKPGTWHALGVNDINIAAQVANPHDLVRGRGSDAPHYKTSTAAVAEMWAPKKQDAPAASAGGAAQGGATAAAQGGTP